MSSSLQPHVSRSSRQDRLNQAFIALSDTLIRDFDILDVFDLLVRTCVEVLEVDSAGILLSDTWGRLKVVASSSEAMEALELLALQSDEGPCVESYRVGEPVAVSQLDRSHHRWPTFTRAAIAAGYASVQALPLRLREQNIGALNLFHRRTEAMTDADVRVAQALADVATIAILKESADRSSWALIDQLQHALDGRIIIEQATGRLAERGNITQQEAAELLRAYSRSHQQKISGTARQIVDRTLPTDAVVGG
jgi:transcriptional regulator with GAF, ATPase, and Fis domain